MYTHWAGLYGLTPGFFEPWIAEISHSKPRRWKSMLIHQGWFTALYTQHLLDSPSLEFEICIFPREAIPSQMYASRLLVDTGWFRAFSFDVIYTQQRNNKHACSYSVKKVQVGKGQEKAQSEKDSHSKNQGGKNLFVSEILSCDPNFNGPCGDKKPVLYHL